MNYSDLNLSVKADEKELKYNNNTIKVLQYLPMMDKYDLVNVTLQKAKNEDGTYNDFKLTMYFQLGLVYMYSDLVFTMEDRIDEADIYDKLRTSGLLGQIISLIPKEENDFLYNAICTEKETRMEYGTRAGAVINELIRSLPEQMEKSMDILKDFDPEKFKEVMNFATAANGNRDINTNEPIPFPVEE